MAEIIKGGEQLQKFLAKVAKQKARVDVGFFPDAKYPDGTQVAEVAIYNEYGTLTKGKKEHIPPRPFMQPTFNAQKAKWMDILAKSINNQQENIDVKKALNIVGIVAQDDVKASIDEWAKNGNPRNEQATIAKKGFDSPLIETGHMRDSVHYKVNA